MLKVSAFYLKKQKSVIPKKIISKPQSLNGPRQFQQMAHAVLIFIDGFGSPQYILCNTMYYFIFSLSTVCLQMSFDVGLYKLLYGTAIDFRKIYSLVSKINSFIFVRFISYLKCSNWHQISKLSMNSGCLFTFCYLDGANSTKTDLHICNLWTGQFVTYK